MKVSSIQFSKEFSQEYQKLPQHIQEKVKDVIAELEKDPLIHGLRLHELEGENKGLRTISINMDYRITFEVNKKGEATFHRIGTHEIYE